jgi:hypothetical protein
MLETAVCLLAIIALGVAFLVLRNFGIGYGNRKGSNRADLEDISRLTKLAEDIKHQNAEVLETMKSQQQLRMIAAERRIQAHQEAFALWRKLIANVYTDNIGEVAIECQKWWENHCLYLEPDAREAFNLAYARAPSHAMVVEGGRERGNVSAVQAHWKGIMDCGQILFHSIKLPGLTDQEQKFIPAPWEPPPQ